MKTKAKRSAHSLNKLAWQARYWALLKFVVQRSIFGYPLATQAGADVLEQGGNAIDAMVAVQLMLGLVEPQSSGPEEGNETRLLKWS